MFKEVVPPRRGAPKQDPIDVLRTRVWMGVVKLRSDLPSAYAVELATNPELVSRRIAGVVRPRKWDAYEKGLKVPKPVKGKRYAVEQAEALAPGASRYFNSMIWDVLKKKSLSAGAIDAELRRLEPSVAGLLLDASTRPGESNLRFRAFDAAVVDELVALGTFDCLVVAVLQVAKSELIGSLELRELAFRCYLRLQARIAELPEIRPWSRELYFAIDTTCKHWVFPHPNARMDIVIFSDQLRLLPPTAATVQDVEKS